LGKEKDSVQISSARSKEINGSLVTLSAGETELNNKKRSVNICLGQQHSVQIRTFCDYWGKITILDIAAPVKSMLMQQSMMQTHCRIFFL
jgi:hypothetical protein